ncbi:PrgI family protein [Cellulosimicrobium funkei]|nr:PrgI family protein [Cellulosimicrobium funkei]
MAEQTLEQQLDSPWDGARFARERTTGVLLGLNWSQVITLGSALALMLILVFVGGFPRGFFAALVIGAVAAGIVVPKVMGRPLIGWVGLWLRYLLRGARDQLTFVRREGTDDDGGLDEPASPVLMSGDVSSARDGAGRIKPGAGARFRLPGEANELRVYVLPGGAGFVYDPRRGEGIVCAKINTSKAFSLESFEAQEDRTAHWSETISAIARMPGVVRVQHTDQSTLISGSKVMEYYNHKSAAATTAGRASAEQINPFLHAAFVELMAEAQDMPVHETWLTLVFSRDKIAKRIKSLGGGLPGFMQVALSAMTTIEGTLPASGTVVRAWHSPRSLAALVRSAFDPDASVVISERSGDWVGVAPGSAGPMAMEVFADHVRTDGYLHRTYKVSEFPQSQAGLGFLEPLVFAGDFRHTVSVVWSPRDVRKALNQVQRRKADWRTTTRLLDKLDRPHTLEHDRELEDIKGEETELVSGHARLDLAVLITVTGADEMELEANCADVLSRAVKASCELRVAYLEQDSAMLAAALPFGMVEM